MHTELIYNPTYRMRRITHILNLKINFLMSSNSFIGFSDLIFWHVPSASYILDWMYKPMDRYSK